MDQCGFQMLDLSLLYTVQPKLIFKVKLHVLVSSRNAKFLLFRSPLCDTKCEFYVSLVSGAVKRQ